MRSLPFTQTDNTSLPLSGAHLNSTRVGYILSKSYRVLHSPAAATADVLKPERERGENVTDCLFLSEHKVFQRRYGRRRRRSVRVCLGGAEEGC